MRSRTAKSVPMTIFRIGIVKKVLYLHFGHAPDNLKAMAIKAMAISSSQIMKCFKISVWWWVFALLAIPSCSEELPVNPSGSQNLIKKTIRVSGDPQLRSALQEDGSSVSWAADDAITVLPTAPTISLPPQGLALRWNSKAA